MENNNNSKKINKNRKQINLKIKPIVYNKVLSEKEKYVIEQLNSMTSFNNKK
jgi:hypothetical protein